jgi:hypothetical protein
MVKSIEGIWKDGRIELLEAAPAVSQARVIVTFLEGSIDLRARGITPEQTSDLRARLKAFEQDWQRPDMDAYDSL